MILRPYQSAAVDQIGEALTRYRSVCYTLPTGGGKTPIMAEIARLCHEYGSRTVILTHRDTLLSQTINKLRDIGVPHSVIAPGRLNYGDAVQVASVQTLVRRLDRYQAFDLVMIDEGHHALAGSYQRIVGAWPDARVLGVTATPVRLDGRGLGESFQHMILGPSISELTADGWLAPSVSYAAKKLVDLSKAKVSGGDYAKSDLQDIMDRNEVTGDAVRHYAALCPGKPAIVFCVSIEHARSVALGFEQAGFRAASVDSKMRASIVRKNISSLADGSVQVLCSCDLIGEGYDCPAIYSAILLRPTKSVSVYLQQVGRALRPSISVDAFSSAEERVAAISASEKPRALILDHAGNCFRFGLPDEERGWSLDAKKKKGVTAVGIKQCAVCYAVCPPWKKTCPVCGAQFVVVAADREANEVAGELVEVDRVALRSVRIAEERAARTYPELVELGRRRGYAPGWAFKKWIERGGDPAEAI